MKYLLISLTLLLSGCWNSPQSRNRIITHCAKSDIGLICKYTNEEGDSTCVKNPGAREAFAVDCKFADGIIFGKGSK